MDGGGGFLPHSGDLRAGCGSLVSSAIGTIALPAHTPGSIFPILETELYIRGLRGAPDPIPQAKQIAGA